jgi:hypothetical protein
MDGREFLHSARHLMALPNEANWRSVASRLYLALLHEAQAALERWGFPRPVQEDIHNFVFLRFDSSPNLDLLRVGDALKRLGTFAQDADFALETVGAFVDASAASHHLILSQVGIDLLDQIDNDPARRVAGIADIRARWP